MGKVVDAANKATLQKSDLTLYVSTNVARAYIRALGGFGTAGFRCCWYQQSRYFLVF